MNFLTHYKTWIDRIKRDDRLKTHHIALYLALFETWNRRRFKTPIIIYRDDMMILSRIGSVHTYTKALRELTTWEYIRYEPSYNRFEGSKVHMFTFDQRSDQESDQRSDQGSDQESEQGSDPDCATIIKTIENSENIENTSNIKTENTYGTSTQVSNYIHDGKQNAHTETTDTGGDLRREKKETSGGWGRSGPRDQTPDHPTGVEEAETYFQEIGSNQRQAQTFFDYYQAIGWKINGNAPVNDWRALARRWLANAPRFTPKPQHPNAHPAGRLHVNLDKDYGEDL